ncbi:zona pellucida-binding protein 1-like [Alligator sinensis]|uniref:Zona pellucida-binding protein 1-like n=1 Tax=Alligator sinensis TaxID=38654 RepID=A0A3Q0G2U8_ALLSI|nr:zona pellucida-binding protein 1-like [Alligator sinensis]
MHFFYTDLAKRHHFFDKILHGEEGVAHSLRENSQQTYDDQAFSETGDVASIPDAPKTSVEVLGLEGSTVSVYVLINSKDLILKCLTKKLLMQRIIDPKYQWIGPMGLITKESQRFLLTDEGNLEVYNIHASDSGSYTCSVIYMHNDRHVITEFSFMVYDSFQSVHILLEEWGLKLDTVLQVRPRQC